MLVAILYCPDYEYNSNVLQVLNFIIFILKIILAFNVGLCIWIENKLVSFYKSLVRIFVWDNIKCINAGENYVFNKSEPYKS